MPQGESIQDFCLKNKAASNLFHKWYKDTRHQTVPVQVEGQLEMDTQSSSPLFLPRKERKMIASRDILIEKLQKENAALKEQKKQDRKNLYGSKSQKVNFPNWRID